ncbi:hypothetical protein D9758_015261 [Tetrapyrgos nigripes]|uniref:Uncharacterized protein n=1 Tax=Tetrapyrgos nigripes TaxID=182062 RepID=A0A8H5C268_9AGAR|nr:hypothetical protein D9758_015261 [Tetrapyrgos nigripes]
MGATNPAVVGWVLGSVGLLLLALGTVVYGRKRNAMRKRKAPSFAQGQTQTHEKSGSSEKDKEYGTLRTLAGRSRTDNLKANLNLYCKGRGCSWKVESPLPLILGSSGGVAEEFEKVNLSYTLQTQRLTGESHLALALESDMNMDMDKDSFTDSHSSAYTLPFIETPSDVRRNRRQYSNDNADANSVSDDEGLDHSDIDSFTIVWDDEEYEEFLTEDRRALEEVLSLTNTLPDRVPEKPSTLLLSNDDFEQVSVDSLVALRAKHETFHAVHAIRTRGRVIPASSPPNPGESLRKQITRAFYDEMKLSENRGITTGHGRRICWQEKQTLTGNAASAAAVATTTANTASFKRKRIFLQYQVPLYQDGVDTARVTQIHPLRIGSFRLIAVYYTLAKVSPGLFSLRPPNPLRRLQAALQSGLDFILGYVLLPCASPTDAQALRSLVLKFAGHPNQLRYSKTSPDPLPLVSTFSGEACTFGQDSPLNGWSSQLTQHDELKGKITFVPSFFMDPNSFNEFVDGGVMDGDFNWNGAWPVTSPK